MYKQALGVVIILLSMVLAAFAAEMLDIDWKKAETKISDYKEIYLLSLDFRDIKVEVFDDEDHEYYEEDISAEDYEKLANDLYERFNHRLKDVIAMNPAKVIDKTKKALILEVKLSGLFQMNEQGWMMKKIFGAQQHVFDLKIDGSLFDSISGDEVLTFKSTKAFSHDSDEIPMTDSENMDGIWEAFDFWARQLARQLAERKVSER